MYTGTNFKTKKALKEAVASGRKIDVFQPGPFAKPGGYRNEVVTIEGPHGYHTWYAQATLDADGYIVKVK